MSERRSWLGRAFLNNKRAKALSLVLGVISWYAIQDAISFEVVIPDIPVQVEAKKGWAILNQSATVVDVTFRGSREDIRLINPKEIKASVDLSKAALGMQEVTIHARNIEGARGVRVVEVKPHRVRVSLDREGEREVQVKGMYAGKPLLGQVESVTCEPAAVTIKGPEQRLETTECVYTVPVDVDGRIESFSKSMRVLPPSETWSARIEPPDVQVRVCIVAKSAERTWTEVPVMPVMAPGVPVQADIIPHRANVILRGRSEVLEGIKDGDVRVLVDCQGMEVPGEAEARPYVHLATAAKDLAWEVKPDQVRVILKRP